MQDYQDYISNLIKQGEHLHLDFKFEINDTKKIARSLSAFANTEGGILLIGVKDNGKISGIRSEEELHMIEVAAHLHTKPEVKFSATKHIIKGKLVLEISVPKSKLRPHLAPDLKQNMRAFIRVADENKTAHIVHYTAWIKQKKELPVKINYSDKEQILLDSLTKHKKITLKKYQKTAGITRKCAVDIMSDFLNLRLISINYNTSPVSFSLPVSF